MEPKHSRRLARMASMDLDLPRGGPSREKELQHGQPQRGQLQPAQPYAGVACGAATAAEASRAEPETPESFGENPSNENPSNEGPVGDTPAGADPAGADPSGEDPAWWQPGSTGEHQLQQSCGTRARADKFYTDQVLDHLNDEMIEFVERMDMAFIATADANGEADCSLRAGPPGFLQVLDTKQIAYPEYRGNGVMASLGNISENPHIGIMLLDFVRDQIGLHLNGRARIVSDPELRAECSDLPEEFVRGRIPERWVVVEVTEAYIHCRKHIPRLKPVERHRAWGTDNSKRKGGDYFKVREQRRDDASPAGPAGPA